MLPSGFRNKILNALDERTLHHLQLSPVQFSFGEKLQSPGEPLTKVFFPETGMASRTALFTDGSQVEVGMFGYDSMIGVSGLMGATHSLNRIYIQIPGQGYVSPLKAAIKEFRLCGHFHQLALRYVLAQLVQATQFAACNAKHTVEERLASWLMLCRDRTQCDSFPLSHEFIAYMLGSTRSTVSLIAAELKNDGLIEYSRGTMHILNLKGLEQRVCECYPIVRDHLASSTELGQAFSA
jgi:CRP-like cAMP-binding protein